MTRLGRAFFDRPTLDVARDLIGKVLVRRGRDGLTSGAIVEVEAYVGEDDPACHAATGPTARNAPLYGPPGIAYVYLNYGIHSLFNVVTEAEGRPAAVLVRALVPLDGTALMRRRRTPDRSAGVEIPDHELCRGPGSLTRAMGITLADNRADLCAVDPPGRTSTASHSGARAATPRSGERRLFIEDRGIEFPGATWTRRIGIRVGTDRLWRCSVAGRREVSGRRGR